MSLTFTLAPPTPRFTRPRLLTHPQIPPAAHGMNPRSFKGKAWWDKQRKEAYAANNLCCWACGIWSGDAKYHQWLEAHESYNINYLGGILTLDEIVALCYSCHKFIHSGHLWRITGMGPMTWDIAQEIVFSRMEILKKHKLRPSWGTRAVYLRFKGMTRASALIQVFKDGLVDGTVSPPRHKWKLIVDEETFNYRGEVVES